jgi:hypothetical protein
VCCADADAELQGRGHGDLRLLVNVAVPTRLGEEQRRLLEVGNVVPGDVQVGRR